MVQDQNRAGCQCDKVSENIWLTWCKPSNYSIFGEGRSDYVQKFPSKTRLLLWKGSSKNPADDVTDDCNDNLCNLNSDNDPIGQLGAE